MSGTTMVYFAWLGIEFSRYQGKIQSAWLRKIRMQFY